MTAAMILYQKFMYKLENMQCNYDSNNNGVAIMISSMQCQH